MNFNSTRFSFLALLRRQNSVEQNENVQWYGYRLLSVKLALLPYSILFFFLSIFNETVGNCYATLTLLSLSLEQTAATVFNILTNIAKQSTSNSLTYILLLWIFFLLRKNHLVFTSFALNWELYRRKRTTFKSTYTKQDIWMPKWNLKCDFDSIRFGKMKNVQHCFELHFGCIGIAFWWNCFKIKTEFSSLLQWIAFKLIK